MIGGKAVMKVRAHRISHPPRVAFHFSAYGSNQPNIFELNIRNSIPRTRSIKIAIPANTLCRGVIFLTVLETLLWIFSAPSIILSLKFDPLFANETGRCEESECRVQGGLKDELGERGGEVGNDNARAVEE